MDGNNTGNPAGPDKLDPHTPEDNPASEQDDFESASQSTVDLDQFMPRLKPKHGVLRVVIWFLVILIIAAGIGGGAYWYSKHKSAAKPAQHSQQQLSQSQPVITAATKQYQSSNFNLSFNYPQDWAVSDTGNGKLTVTSPDMQLKGTDGRSQTGQVVLTIQNESSMSFSMFAQGNAAAVLNSQHITYTNPTPTQRASTYVSFLQYVTTTAHGALDGVYVTGDAGYQQGQAIPEVDITKVDPVITVTFQQCTNVTCGSVKVYSIDASMWSDTGFSGPIMKMIESLAIQ